MPAPLATSHLPTALSRCWNATPVNFMWRNYAGEFTHRRAEKKWSLNAGIDDLEPEESEIAVTDVGEETTNRFAPKVRKPKKLGRTANTSSVSTGRWTRTERTSSLNSTSNSHSRTAQKLAGSSDASPVVISSRAVFARKRSSNQSITEPNNSEKLADFIESDDDESKNKLSVAADEKKDLTKSHPSLSINVQSSNLESTSALLAADVSPSASMAVSKAPSPSSMLTMSENAAETDSVTALTRDPAMSMFEKNSNSNRPAPDPPSIEGIEYPRAASWSSSTVAEILRDPKGKQLFRCFLYDSLAEENLLFVEAIDKLRKEKDVAKIKSGLENLLDNYSQFINLSSVAMSKLREASTSDTPDIKSMDMAHKEISKLLENDQFPRFRRSKVYLDFLERLLPRIYAEKWATSFDALLGNQVGRHHFRQYLFSVHAEENLRFWESVVEFRGLKNKSTAMLNMGRNIQQQFLREGAHNEVFLPFGLRQKIEKRIKEKEVNETLFDEAVKHVEQILKNDPYVRFLQSREYNNLLDKLH